MNNNKNLNPLNDPEVAEMLTMSQEDQLWSFLDDCVPYDGKDAVLLIMMSVAKSKSKEDWLMEDAEQSECVRRMIKEREKKKAGKAL